MTSCLPSARRAWSLLAMVAHGALAAACSYDLHGFGTESPPVCGNGMLEGDEQCEPGLDTNCSENCTFAVCGDGKPEGQEECDDGNNDDTDECTSECKKAFCGDGKRRLDEPTPAEAEECDDGNNDDTDECTIHCRRPYCGDGIRQKSPDGESGEFCDEGTEKNNQPGGACTPLCTEVRCGDEYIGAGEECDDGDSDNSDSCTENCKLPYCGDGFIQSPETCDDPSDPACPDDCIEVPNTCGDGVFDGAVEECDPPNTDTCGPTCLKRKCGDGVTDPNEECDGSAKDGFACRACKEYHENVWSFGERVIPQLDPSMYNVASPDVNDPNEVACFRFTFWDWPKPSAAENKLYRFAHDFEFDLGITHPRVGELAIFVSTAVKGRRHLMRRPGIAEGNDFDNTMDGALADLKFQPDPNPAQRIRFTLCDPMQVVPDSDCDLPSAESMGAGLQDGDVVCEGENVCSYQSDPGDLTGVLLDFKGLELKPAPTESDPDPPWTMAAWNLCVQDTLANEHSGTVNSVIVKVWRRQTKE